MNGQNRIKGEINSRSTPKKAPDTLNRRDFDMDFKVIRDVKLDSAAKLV
jgi:hypothetical protein